MVKTLEQIVGKPKQSYAQQTQTEKRIWEADLNGNVLGDNAAEYNRYFGFIPTELIYMPDGIMKVVFGRNPNDNFLSHIKFLGNLQEPVTGAVRVPDSPKMLSFVPMQLRGNKLVAVFYGDENAYRIFPHNGLDDFLNKLPDRSNGQLRKAQEIQDYLSSLQYRMSQLPRDVISVDIGPAGTEGLLFPANGTGPRDANGTLYKDINTGNVVPIGPIVGPVIDKLKRDPNFGQVTKVGYVNRGGIERIVVFEDRQNRVTNDISLKFTHFMTGEPANGVLVRIGNQSYMSDGGGNVVIPNLQDGSITLLLEGSIIPEALVFDKRGGRKIDWKVLPPDFPSELFRSLYFWFMNNRLCKLSNPQDMDFQIFIGQSDYNRWETTPSTQTIDKFVNMSKLTIRGGLEYFYDLSIPESQIRVITSEPRYGPSTFVVGLRDTYLGGATAGRVPRVQGNEITSWIVDFKTNLGAIFPQSELSIYLREIWGAIFNIVGEPILGHSNGLAERYDAYSDWVGYTNNPQLESFLRSKLSLGYYSGFGRETFSNLLELDQMMAKAANARPAGYTIKPGTNDFYVRLIN